MAKTIPAQCPYVARYGEHSYGYAVTKKFARKGTWSCDGCTHTIVAREKDLPAPFQLP
ncbi:hypothetical protein [Amycolatopsis sp. FDAARGOS 1241]|uniref:hypothetical protein n=1 Tax=Amycolatopsis sp. FDAARGOS 1241 TaxID=2778070 RepID=UPI001951A0E1|nr:hypothetical protein [Amycolatopsis sp. FDAARGOS 1241]QRP46958.1 hypothetical protein I6J71_02635 [Amycolatopsis sp. FDAARGOS 1241]